MNMIGTLRRVLEWMRPDETHHCPNCRAQCRTVAVMDGDATKELCQHCGAVLRSWRAPPETAKVRLRQLGEDE